MNQYDLSKIYQELYYHELDSKEKIATRLQLTFAFHASIITVIIYMLRMVDSNGPKIVLVMFVLGLFPLLIYLIKSIRATITAFWGNTYKALATADDIEKYRKLCIDYAKELKQFNKNNPHNKEEKYCPEQSINEFLYNEFSKCASHNSKVNEERSKQNHLAIKYLLSAAVPFFLISALFMFFEMDASSPKKPFLIEYQGITDSIEQISIVMKDELIPLLKNLEKDRSTNMNELITTKLKEITMAEEKNQNNEPKEAQQPPAPPKPPSTRDILEDTGPYSDRLINGEVLND